MNYNPIPRDFSIHCIPPEKPSSWRAKIKMAVHLSDPLEKEYLIRTILHSNIQWTRQNMKALAKVIIQCATDVSDQPLNGSDRFAVLSNMFCKAYAARFSNQSFTISFKEVLDETFLSFWGNQSDPFNLAGPIGPNSLVACVDTALLLCAFIGSLCPNIITRDDIKHYILTSWTNATTIEHLYGVHLIFEHVNASLWRISVSPASRVAQFLEESSLSPEEAVKRCTAYILGSLPCGFTTISDYAAYVVARAKYFADRAVDLNIPRETRRVPPVTKANHIC